MTFIKSLKRNRKEKGQAALEYFILSAVMAGVVWWALAADDGALRRIQGTLQGMPDTDGLFQTAVGPQGLNVLNE